MQSIHKVKKVNYLLSLFVLVFSFIIFNHVSAADFYLSPSGSDTTGAGTISSPWFTLNKAWTVVSAGDTIYLRGGTYAFNTQQRLTGKSGTNGNLIKVWAYGGETPNLTKSASYTTNSGIFFKGDYVHFKGLEISGYTQIASGNSSGMRAENSNYNIFESLNIHHNGLGMDMANLGYTEHATGNLILNSDFHHNQDPFTSGDPYGNADGISLEWITHSEDINTIRGCRSWSNTDDGYDFYKNEGTVIVENSSAFLNGYIPDTLTPAGDGNGFKLGPTVAGYASTIKRYVNNTISFNNRMNGYDLNGGRFKTQFFNNTSYQNGNKGFRMADDAFGESLSHIVKNNISYQNVGYNSEFSPASILNNNTFLIGTGSVNSSYSVTSSDFLSLSSTGMDGSRQSDGSWPNVNFLKLASGSDLIDRGTDIGLPYNGVALDLGANESNYIVADTISPVISSFNIPSTSSTLAVSFGSLTATDALGVTGYLVTESSSTPSLSNTAWSMSFPSYTFLTQGSKTLYAWAKDAAGNISTSVSRAVVVTLPVVNVVTADTPAPVTTIVTAPSSGGGGSSTSTVSSGGGGSSSSSSGGGSVSSSSNPIIVQTPVTQVGTTSIINNTNTTNTSYYFTSKLSLGSKGNEVKTLQNYLNSLGYDCGIADGILGKKSFNAIKIFQLDNNLISDGIVGAGTRALLNKSNIFISTNNTVSNSTSNNATVQPGLSKIFMSKYCKYLSKGNDPIEVKKLQQILINNGYLHGVADGIFGKQTLNAVIRFQKDNNLYSDGVVGPSTLTALNK